MSTRKLVCKQCGITFDKQTKHLDKNRELDDYCCGLDCAVKYRKGENRKSIINGKRYCTICCQWKNVDNFGKCKMKCEVCKDKVKPELDLNLLFLGDSCE
jgi:hypothetical protein